MRLIFFVKIIEIGLEVNKKRFIFASALRLGAHFLAKKFEKFKTNFF